jgi:Type IV secretory pathway, VirB4 components
MPLSRIKTKPHEAVEWLEIAIESTKTTVTPAISKDLMEVATGWDDSVPTVERFTKKLRGFNPDNEAIPALEKILESKQLSNLFGGECDEFNNSSFGQKTMIEMGSLMGLGDVAVYPALQFIFSRLDELFDTDPKPTLLVMDEAWLFLNHRIFRTKIKEWLKTLRKKRVFVIMAIQNINDIDDPEEFLTSCHTKVYLANPELKGEGSLAIREAYRKMGVSDAEMEIIGNGTRKRD